MALFSAFTCRSEVQFQFAEVDYLPSSQVHNILFAKPLHGDRCYGDRFAVSIRNRRKPLEAESIPVRARDHFLRDVANPQDQCDRLAVVVNPLLAGAETQARLQAALQRAIDFLAPGGEALLLLVLVLVL